MHPLSKRYVAYLLAIMLTFSPFQNLMASSLSCAGMDGSPPHHMMNMVDIDSMPVVSNTSEQNNAMKCCQDKGCALGLGHCVTSTATLNADILIPTSPQIDAYVLPYVSQLLSQISPPLFRPPIA